MNQQHPRRSSEQTLLWGFMITLLTFLMVVIVVTTIGLLDGNAPTTPSPTPGGVNDTPAVEPDTPTDRPSDPPAQQPEQTDPPREPSGGTADTPTEPATSYLMYEKSGQTQTIPSYDGLSGLGAFSAHAVVVDVTERTVLASKGADEVIYPASMTKVMTLLVACEHLAESDYDTPVTVSAHIVQEMQRRNASGFGFAAGDVLTVKDLLYAIALESDGVASMQIAEYVAGSQQAFVDLMNQRCAAMGLTQTHFVNATGLHDAGHYTTCREMASIMAAAMDVPLLRQLLSGRSYVTYITHRGTPNLRVTFYSTYYMRVMSPDFKGEGAFYSLPAGASVIAAKTGLTDEAGNCLVSCIRSDSGRVFVAVTAGATNITAYCADLLYLYQTYMQ